MTGNAVVPGGSGLPESLKGKVLPGEIRAKARKNLVGDLNCIRQIVRNEEEKGATRVQAAKLLALVAGVTSSQTVPRDVIEEKIKEMVRYLRQSLGDEAYASMASDLSKIWNF